MSVINPIYNSTIGPLLNDKAKELFFKSIADANMKSVSFEKFNRLCDLFFYIPGQITR